MPRRSEVDMFNGFFEHARFSLERMVLFYTSLASIFCISRNFYILKKNLHCHQLMESRNEK